jgi:hypothetical protein
MANHGARVGPTEFLRTRYFPRMVVAPEDLTRDQMYQINKRRHWTLLLHGWGIVRGGLRLSRDDSAAGDPLLRVSAGDAITRAGEDITLGSDVRIDPTAEDGHGNARVFDGEYATPDGGFTRSDRRDGVMYLVAVRPATIPARYVRAPFGPRPDGSGRCEVSVSREVGTFRLVADRSADELSAEGWVVLGAVIFSGADGLEILPDHRQDLPFDVKHPPVDPPGEPGDVVAAINVGDLLLAEKHLRAWKAGIREALHSLLDDEGLEKLAAIGSLDDLRDVPARCLRNAPGDHDSADSLRAFYRQARSRDASRKEISVVCLAGLGDEEFLRLLRNADRNRQISDRVALHVHRAASLVFALVKQWPSPSFEELR